MTELPAPHTAQPPVAAHSLNQPFTLAEVEVGLQQLHNGRSGALRGHIAELLRYAKLVPTPEVLAPAHLLAPCLVVLKQSGFQHWASALVVEDPLGHSCLQEGGRHRHSQLQANLSWSAHQQAMCQLHGTVPGQVHRAATAAVQHSDRVWAGAWHHPPCLWPSACH